MSHGSGGGGRSGHGGGGGGSNSGGFGGATDLEGMGGGSSGTGSGGGGSGGETKLRIREHADTGPYVEGLSWHAVDSYAAVEALIRAGNMSRAVASTNMNAASSRSHALFTLRYKRTIINPATGGLSDITSKISLIDLAGSERVSKTGAEGERLKEAGAINKSLSTLGLVISALAKRASGAPAGSGGAGAGGAGPDGMPSTAGTFVPYRESVLTWLLKDSLGGNAKTCMIATVSPSPLQYEETLSTLRYSERAKLIRNHAVVNEDANVALIRQLREELTSLRAQLAELRASGGGGGGGAGGVVYRDNPELLAQVEMLKMKNVFQEQLLRQLHSQWEERLRSTSEGLRQHEAGMRGLGVGVAAADGEADEDDGGADGEGDADEWGEADWGLGLEGEGAAATPAGGASTAAANFAVVVEEAGDGEEDDWGLGGGDGGDGADSSAGATAAPATPGQAPDAATAASTARTGGKPGHRRASLSGTSSRATPRALPVLFLRQADSQLDRQIGFPLPGDGFASVGSAADNQIRLTSAGILQHHCTISCETASATAPSSEGQGQGQPGGVSFLLQPEGGATVYVNGNRVGASSASETSSPAVPSPAFSSGSGSDAPSAAGSTGGSSMLSLASAAPSPSVRLRHGDRIIFGDLPVVLSFEWPAQVAAACGGSDDATSGGAVSGAGAEPIASRAAAAVAWSYDMAIGEWRAGGGAPSTPSHDVSLSVDGDGDETAAFSYSAALDLGGLGEGDDDEWGLGAASGSEGDAGLHGASGDAGVGGDGEVGGLQTVMAELGLDGLGEDDVPVATASLVDLLGGETDTLAEPAAAPVTAAADAAVATSLAQRLDEAAAPAAPAAEAPAPENKPEPAAEAAAPAAAAAKPAAQGAASLSALERLQRHVQRQVRCQDTVLLSLSDARVRGRLERRMRHLAALVSEANSLLAATGLPLRLSRRALWLPGGAFSMASAGRRPSAFGGLGGAAGALIAANAAGSGLLTWERLAQEQDVRWWDLGVSLWHSTSDSGDARRGGPGGQAGSRGGAAAPVAVALIDERSLEAALDELRAQYGLLLDNAGVLPTVEGANSARGGGLSTLTPSGGPEGVQRGLILSLLRRCCAQLRPGALTDADAVVPTTQGSTMPSAPPPVVTLGSCVVGLVSSDEASISPTAAAAAATASAAEEVGAATTGPSRGPLVLFDSQRKAALSTSWGASAGSLQLRVRGERAAGGGNTLSVSVGAPSIILPAGQGAGDAGARLIVRCQVVQPQWSALPPINSGGDAGAGNPLASPQAVKPPDAAGAAAAKWSQWQFVLRRGKEVAAPAGATAAPTPAAPDAAADASALALLPPLSHAEWLLESEVQDAAAAAAAAGSSGDAASVSSPAAAAATTAAPTGAPAAREVRLGFAGGLPVGWALRCIVEYKPGTHRDTVAGALAAASASPAGAAPADGASGSGSSVSTGPEGEEPVVLSAAALGSVMPPSTSPFLARLLSDCARPPPVCVVPSLRYADALSRGLFEPPSATGGLLVASPFVRHTHPAAYALPSWNPARSAASGFGVGASRLRLTVLADVMGGDHVQLLPARLPGVVGATATGTGSAPSSPSNGGAAAGSQSTRNLLDASAWGAVTPLPVLRLPREEDSGPRAPGAPPIVSMEPVFVVPPGMGGASAAIISGYGGHGSFGQQLFVAVSVMQLRDGSPFALETCLHAHVTDVRRLPVSSTLATPDVADVTVSIAAPQEGALPFIQHRDPAGRALRVLIRLPPPRQPPASGLPSRGPVLETLTDCLASETPRGHRVYLRLQLGMTVRGSSNTVSFARWLALETLTPAVRSGSAPHPLYPAFSGKRDASLLAAPPKDASAPGTPVALAGAGASAGAYGVAGDAASAMAAAAVGPPPIVPHPMWAWYQRSPPSLSTGESLGGVSGAGGGGGAGSSYSWAPAILGGLEATPSAVMTAADVWARVYALYRRCDVDVSRRWEAAGPTTAPAARAAAEQLVSLARNQALAAFGSSRISAVCAGAASTAAGAAAAAGSGATPAKGGAESTAVSPDRERAGSASASSSGSTSTSPWDSLIPPSELSVRVPRCDAIAVSRMGADKAGYLSKGRARLGGSVRRYWVLQPPFMVSFQTAAACDTNQRPDAVVHLMELVSIADDRGPLGLRRPALPYAPGSDVALGLGLGLGLAGASAGAGADSALPDNAGASALDDLAEVVPLSCLTDGDMDAAGWPPYATAARATGLLGSALGLGLGSAYGSSGGGSAAAVGLASPSGRTSFFASAASPRGRMLVIGGSGGNPSASPTSAGGAGGGDGMPAPAPVSTSPSFSITHRPLGGGPEHTRTLQAPSVAEKDSWLKALLLACERSTRLGPW